MKKQHLLLQRIAIALCFPALLLISCRQPIVKIHQAKNKIASVVNSEMPVTDGPLFPPTLNIDGCLLLAISTNLLRTFIHPLSFMQNKNPDNR